MEEYYTEVRVGTYEGDLPAKVRKYRQEFTRMPVGRGDVRKYALQVLEGQDSYIIIVSQRTGQATDHNIMMTVQGPRQETVKELMSDLESKIGFETRPAPETLQLNFDIMAKLLHEYLLKSNS